MEKTVYILISVLDRLPERDTKYKNENVSFEVICVTKADELIKCYYNFDDQVWLSCEFQYQTDELIYWLEKSTSTVQGYSLDIVENSFKAGRKYQQGEVDVYYGKPENTEPSLSEFLASLPSPSKEEVKDEDIEKMAEAFWRENNFTFLGVSDRFDYMKKEDFIRFAKQSAGYKSASNTNTDGIK